MKFKVGQILYVAYYDIDTCKVESVQWEIRTIRGGRATAIEKNSETWIKLSKKNFDWGWSPSIPSCFRKTWSLDRDWSFSMMHLFLTKKAAWEDCLDTLLKYEDDGDAKTRLEKNIRTQIAKCK